MEDLEDSSLTVYTNLSAIADFECTMSQSLFQPATWAGSPAPAFGGNFARVFRFLYAGPTRDCSASATCSACLLAGPGQMVRPTTPCAIALASS